MNYAPNKNVSLLCKYAKISRQAYYKSLTITTIKDDFEHIIAEVKSIRSIMPRIGTRKLYYLLKSKISCLNIGRDRLFKLLRIKDLLIYPKRQYRKTTNSLHRFYVHKNLIEDLSITRKNQVWVSDITYIKTLNKHCYLALITDVFSRKIVGYDISESLSADGVLRALKMGIRNHSCLQGLIHHSDRGIQYCCNDYVSLLQANKIRISMAEKGNCYQNALAERMNGILKDEFNLDANFIDFKEASKTTKQSIYIYNNLRPHWSINLKTPEQIYTA